MRIKRIDFDKDMNKDVDRIEVAIGDTRFLITESFGKLQISKPEDAISIHPCVTNVIEVS